MGNRITTQLDRAIQLGVPAALEPEANRLGARMIRQFIHFLKDLQLSPEAIQQFSMHTRYKDAESGQVISRRGEPADSLIYIHQGLIGLRSPHEPDQGQFYSLYAPNTLINENLALANIPQVVNFVTITECTLAYVPINLYHDALAREPNFRLSMHRFSATRSNRLRLAEFALRKGSPTFRIMLALAYHAMIIGNEMSLSETGNQIKSIALKSPHQLIAELANVSRSVLHEHLRAFVASGFVEHKYRELNFLKTRLIWFKFIERIYSTGVFDANLNIAGGLALMNELSAACSSQGSGTG